MFDSAELLKDVNVFHNNNKIPKKETEKKKKRPTRFGAISLLNYNI